MRVSCAFAAGVVAVATVNPTCAFQVRGPVPTTSFTTGAAISARRVPARSSSSRQQVLQASLSVPGLEWARTRAERMRSGNALNAEGESVPVPEMVKATPATAVSASPEKASSMKVAFYLFVWYSLTIGYNIYNKATLNRMNIPWILSTIQLAVGAVYVSLIWATGIRKAPKLSGANIKAIAPLAFLHTASHICAVVGLSAGAIGFVQIVKVIQLKYDIKSIAYRMKLSKRYSR